MKVKRMVILAMLAAMAYLLVCAVRIPVVLFLSYEPKDVVITVGGFLFGPMASLAVSAVVSLVEMVTISETGPVGCIMNLLSTCAYACTAAAVYKRSRTLGGAVAGLCLGTVVMTGVMLLWNWLITPRYMGVERQAVETLLIPAFLPFNLLKAGLNTALTLAVYKPLVTALRKVRLLEPQTEGTGTSKAGVYLLAAVLLATCILLLLAFQGKL